MRARIFVLPGDGIGPEVTDGAVRVLEKVGQHFGHKFEFGYGYIGGNSVDKYGAPLTRNTMDLSLGADAILLGAVGGPKWNELATDLQPENGLLQLRKNLGLFVNIRPIRSYPQLLQCSPIKDEHIKDVDFVIVRELTGGLYFGKPKKRVENTRGRRALDTMTYTEKQVTRVVRVAFDMAMSRGRRVYSIDKANVLETSRLWRDIATEVSNNYPNVRLQHLLVDNAAMKIISNPRAFDVIVTENTFGDILSDEAAIISGSLGMIPSASLTGSPYSSSSRIRRPGVYEPIHGAAPEMAGLNMANPIGAILSVAMMLDISLKLSAEAEAIVKSVESVIADGYVTRDISRGAKSIVDTSQMGTLVSERIGE